MKEMVEQDLLPQVAHEQIELNEQERAGRWKAYTKYRDSGVEWLGEIPAHWDIKRIKQTMTVINGYPFASELFNFTEGKPLIRIRDLANSSTETYYAGTPVKEATVFNDDILIGMDGDFNVCWWQGGEALLNQRLCCIREKNLVDKRFVYYLLSFPLKLINDLTWFTTVKHLSSAQISSISFGYPPFTEQQTIVAFLNRETTRINTLITKKEQHIALLQERRTAIINQAVTRGLNADVPMKASGVEWLREIPEGWEVRRVKHSIYSIKQGWSPSCENRVADAGEWGVLKVGCVNGTTFNENENKALPKDLKPIPELEIKPSDILMSRANTRELLGSASIVRNVRPGLLLCDKLYRLRINREILLPDFFVLTMRSSTVRFQLERDATGASSSMQNISQFTIVNVLLPVPDIKEQQSIVTYLEQETTKIDKLITGIQESIKKLKEYSTALISATVTGKIDVRGEVVAGSAEDATI